MKQPIFSVIIPHRNDLTGARRTLAALAQMAPASPHFEVILVDNGSAREIAAALVAAAEAYRATLDLRVIDCAETGAGPARNAGAKAARGAMLAFLDCDCIVNRDWLIAAHELLRLFPVVGGPVSVTLAPDQTQTPNVAEAFDLLFGFNVPRGFARHGLLLTANLLMRATVFEAVGRFRNRLSEDRDWCDRARLAGFAPTLSDRLEVQHIAISDAAQLRRRWRRVTRETYAYVRTYRLSRWRWAGYCGAVMLSPLLHMGRIISDPRLHATRARFRLQLLKLLIQIRGERALLGIALLLSPWRSTPEPDSVDRH